MQIKPRKTNPNFMGLDLEILLMFNGKKMELIYPPMVKEYISMDLGRTSILFSNIWTQNNFSSLRTETISIHEIFTKYWLALDGKTVPLTGKYVFTFKTRKYYLSHTEYKSLLGHLPISTYSSCYLKLSTSQQEGCLQPAPLL